MNCDHKVTLLVSTCDAYSVCWEPFCHGLQKYWQDHPQNLWFITNYKDAPCGKTIKVGEDNGWAKNLLFALEQVDTPYILYAQEDYWINRPVENKHIADYIVLMEAGVADYIRLFPAPPPSKIFPQDKRLGILSTNDLYRTSLQMALWRKSVLVDLIQPGETPWKFEKRGNERSRSYGDRFLCVSDVRWGVGYVFTAVVSGEWSRAAYHYAKTESLNVSFNELPQKPFVSRVGLRIKNLVYGTKKRIRRRIRSLFTS